MKKQRIHEYERTENAWSGCMGREIEWMGAAVHRHAVVRLRDHSFPMLELLRHMLGKHLTPHHSTSQGENADQVLTSRMARALLWRLDGREAGGERRGDRGRCVRARCGCWRRVAITSTDWKCLRERHRPGPNCRRMRKPLLPGQSLPRERDEQGETAQSQFLQCVHHSTSLPLPSP